MKGWMDGLREKRMRGVNVRERTVIIVWALRISDGWMDGWMTEARRARSER